MINETLSPMTRPSLVRPTLLPGLPRLWRDRHNLQLGVDPARAVVLELADPRAARLLDLLDGAHSERAVLERAARFDVTPADARTLLDTLRTAGLVLGAQALLPHGLPEQARARLAVEAAALARRGPDTAATPAQALRRRAHARVVVSGPGRLAAPVAVAIAQAGVGHVHPELDGTVGRAEIVGSPLSDADVDRPRAHAVAAAIERAAPGTDVRPVRRGAATLVVDVSAAKPAALLAAAYAQRRQAHLMVAVRDGVAVVGPLVPPAGSPCLNCLELHRRDRDPAWPQLAAQLATGPGALAEPCEVGTVLAAAGFAAAEALGYLDGLASTTLGATVEIAAPGRLRRRTWTPHPACECGPTRRPRPAPRSHSRAGAPTQSPPESV
jgi:bacteriocin biosynthesis cyclodehydratase domain-containing protein